MRVLLTRPGDGIARTAERLRALGYEALEAPVLSLAPTTEPPPSGPFAAIVLTSANAAPFLPAIVGDRPSAPVFAVGERTGAAARDAGAEKVGVGDGNAAALARLIARRVPAGAALLLVAGRDRKPEPEASLRDAGYRVAVWTAYEAVAAENLPRAAGNALRDGRLDAALHYSRRSAATLVRLAEEAGLLPPLQALAHLCLSADVAVPLRNAGARRLAVADTPDEDALFRAIALLPPGPSR